MSCYGNAFYVVELPRRFMVSLWGIPVFWKILPEYWMAIAVAIACIAYDILITSRAPDIKLTQEDVRAKLSQDRKIIHFTLKDLHKLTQPEIDAKLVEGERLYYLTIGELIRRLLCLTAGFGIISLISWYLFSHNLEPVLFARISTAGVILIAVAYISALGIPLRTKQELPAGQTPFLFNSFPLLSKRLGVFIFGWPIIFLWVGMTLLWVSLWSMSNWDGTLSLFLSNCLGVGYCVFMLCIFIMPMAILERKIYQTITNKGTSI